MARICPKATAQLLIKLPLPTALVVSVLFAFATLTAHADLAISVDGSANKGEGLSSWIDFDNDSAGMIDRKGWHLSKNPYKPTNSTFPRFRIAANSYAVAIASG